MSKMLQQFKAARRAGTPIIAIRTTDPEATMLSIQEFNPKTPIVSWDCVQGWASRNGKPGQDAIDAALQAAQATLNATVNLSMHLEVAQHLPYDPEAQAPVNPILFVLNGHKYFDEKEFVQALWNLRDPFKDSLRSVVLLGPDFNLPAELRQDVLILDEPLPTEAELTAIIKTVTRNKINDAKILTRAVDAVRGLPAFSAESVTAMSLVSPGNLNIDGLWDRKRQWLSQQKGLTVWIGGERFDALGGLEAIKAKARRIIGGRRPPRVIVWIEEAEKQAGLRKGGGGDHDSTSSDQQAVILTEIVDKDYTGMILDGVPGSGKSQFAKCFGNEAGILTVRLDLGGSKGEGLVGQAENQIRENLKVIEAIGGVGGAFFIFTSNNAAAMDSALKSRLTKGTWFFDTPDDKEKEGIWNIYFNMYPELDRTQPKPDDGVWTGREIRACVMTAWEENISLIDAARDIIPVAVSDRDDIERMRMAATGRYNSASYPGPYSRNKAMETVEPSRRGRMVAPNAN